VSISDHPAESEQELRWRVWQEKRRRSDQRAIRQQWTCSPRSTVREVEEYQVDLTNVTILELALVPSIDGGPARASLTSLRLS
jgi:hypothetical protein